jgi:hypothetical protein
VKRRVERSLVLQHAVANVKQFPHGSADDHHLFFTSFGKPIAEGFDGGVKSKGRNCWKVHRPTEPPIGTLRHSRIASDGGARLSMPRHEAGVGCSLTRTLESLWGSELTCDDRSGLETDARDRVQQRASAEGFGFSSMCSSISSSRSSIRRSISSRRPRRTRRTASSSASSSRPERSGFLFLVAAQQIVKASVWVMSCLAHQPGLSDDQRDP